MTNNRSSQPSEERELAQAAQSGSITEQNFMKFLNVLLAKEARLAEKEAALDQAVQAKEEQRRQECLQYTVEKMEAQKNCKHLKGGAGRKRGQQKDPAVYQHTFTDATVRIKCNICGMFWGEKDTKEYLFRDGKALKNWTNTGWADAQELAELSSNSPSTSEIFRQKHIDVTKAEDVLGGGSVSF